MQLVNVLVIDGQGDQLFSKTAALPVNDEHIHQLHQKSFSSRRSSAMM